MLAAIWVPSGEACKGGGCGGQQPRKRTGRFARWHLRSGVCSMRLNSATFGQEGGRQARQRTAHLWTHGLAPRAAGVDGTETHSNCKFL